MFWGNVGCACFPSLLLPKQLQNWGERSGVREEGLGVRHQKPSREEQKHTQLSWSGMTCSCSFLLLPWVRNRDGGVAEMGSMGSRSDAGG